MRFRSSRGIFAVTLASVLAAPAVVRAESAVIAAVKAHAKQHSLPTRKLTLDVGGKKVDRLVFPITPQTYTDARHALAGPKGKVQLASIFNGARHLTMSTTPGKDWLFAKENNTIHYRHEPGKVLAGFQLTKGEFAHLTDWIAKNGAKANQGVHCFGYLAPAEVAPGKALFHHLGVSRSKDGDNGGAKLAWAGNKRVEAVGICVADVKAFEAMKDPIQLLGNPPKAGVPDSIHD